MKYEIVNGVHCFSPDDGHEAGLVFEQIRAKLDGFVPFYVDREFDELDGTRNGAWYAWTFVLPWARESSGQPFILWVDVALPVTFRDPGDVLVRQHRGSVATDHDSQDLRHILKRFDDSKAWGRVNMDEARLFQYLRLISHKTGRK